VKLRRGFVIKTPSCPFPERSKGVHQFGGGSGSYRSAGELAEAEGVTRSFVNRLLRLTLLAPDIVEAILDGRQPKAMQLEELTDAIPSEWEKQRKPSCQASPKRVEIGRFSP
jgi:hypothetical protein